MKSGRVEELHYLFHLFGSFLFIIESLWRSGHPQFDMSFDKWSSYLSLTLTWFAPRNCYFLLELLRLLLLLKSCWTFWLTDVLLAQQKCICSLITTTSHAKKTSLWIMTTVHRWMADDDDLWSGNFLLHLCPE